MSVLRSLGYKLSATPPPVPVDTFYRLTEDGLSFLELEGSLDLFLLE